MVLSVLGTNFMTFVAPETGLKFDDFSRLAWGTIRSWQHAWWVGTRGFLALGSKTIGAETTPRSWQHAWWVGTRRVLVPDSKTIEAET